MRCLPLGANEVGTLKACSNIRRELVEPAIAEPRRPDRQADRRRNAGRIRQRRQRRRVRLRNPASDAGAQCRCAGGPAHRIPHRHQSWRRHRRRTTICSATASTSRPGSKASPRPGGVAVSQSRPRPYRQQARPRLRGPGRAAAQEHRAAGADLTTLPSSRRLPQAGQARCGGRSRRRSRRSPSCRSPT